jgi:hypothetical protein
MMSISRNTSTRRFGFANLRHGGARVRMVWAGPVFLCW